MSDSPRTNVAALLGYEADFLLNHGSTAIPKDKIHLTGPDFHRRPKAQSRVSINADRLSLASCEARARHLCCCACAASRATP